MSRDIKFRVWDKINKQMLQHQQISVLLKNVGNNNQFEYMQFTGLLDKNGIEIYEGDIVNFNNNKFGSVVKWNDKGFYQLWRNGIINWKIWQEEAYYNTGYRKGIEVIGNIHENKNLLEAKTEN